MCGGYGDGVWWIWWCVVDVVVLDGFSWWFNWFEGFEVEL